MKTLLSLPLLFVVGFAETPPATDPAVVLPPLIVSDTRALPARESWRYTTIPGFEIISSAPEGTTRELLRDFQLFREALAQVWPLAEPPAQPTLLILCGARGKYDSFLPAAAKADPHRAAASVFLRDRMRSVIVVDCASRTIEGGNTLVESSRELYRQYVYSLMSRGEPSPPVWFIEGFAQIAKSMEFDRKRILFGKLQEPELVSGGGGGGGGVRGGDPSAAIHALLPELFALRGGGGGFSGIGFGVENQGFLDLLKGKALMPLDKFFAVQEGSTDVVASLGTTAIWPQQAYALVHFGLFGEGGKYQKPFAQFVQRLNHEPPSEPLFKECFGLSYKQLLSKIQGYQKFAFYQYMKYRAKGEGLPLPPEPTWRAATQAEIGRIKGDALELAGYVDSARDYLVAPYVRGEPDAPLLASLGLWERKSGQDDRAQKFLEAAFAGKTSLRPDAYVELARYRYNEAIAKPAAPEGKLSAAQVDRIVAPLLAAQPQPPPLAIVYELLADTWRQAQEPPTVEQVELLIRGAQLYPTRFDLIFNTALLCDAVGLNAPARAFAEHGVKFAPDDITKARFTEVIARLH